MAASGLDGSGPAPLDRTRTSHLQRLDVSPAT
jgi:hypothetical protein